MMGIASLNPSYANSHAAVQPRKDSQLCNSDAAAQPAKIRKSIESLD
jgi:hypothetical protein